MSTIKLRLPDPTNSSTPEEFLKQLELCVHHAKKALAVQREVQNENIPREDDFCEFTSEGLFREIKDLKITDIPMNEDTVHDGFWEYLQNIELEITVN